MKVASIANKAVSAIQQRQVDQWLNAEELTAFKNLDSSATTDWLAGRVALKQACLDDLSMNRTGAAGLTVTNSPSGVPSIHQRTGTYCSISHSAGWGVGGVSHRPIGVDIEKIRTRCGALLDYISTEEERAGLAVDGEDADELVTRIWTLKECAMKLWRKGLEIHPKLVRLQRRDADTFTAQSARCNGFLPVVNAFVYRVSEFIIAVGFTEVLNEKPTIHWVDVPGVSTS